MLQRKNVSSCHHSMPSLCGLCDRFIYFVAYRITYRLIDTIHSLASPSTRLRVSTFPHFNGSIGDGDAVAAVA